jgi:hypoxanthine phosphoribosyltransferase
VVSIGKILISESAIKQRVEELGAAISRDYEGKRPILINILKGGIIFLSDLMRQLTGSLQTSA